MDVRRIRIIGAAIFSTGGKRRGGYEGMSP